MKLLPILYSAHLVSGQFHPSSYQQPPSSHYNSAGHDSRYGAIDAAERRMQDAMRRYENVRSGFRNSGSDHYNSQNFDRHSNGPSRYQNEPHLANMPRDHQSASRILSSISHRSDPNNGRRSQNLGQGPPASPPRHSLPLPSSSRPGHSSPPSRHNLPPLSASGPGHLPPPLSSRHQLPPLSSRFNSRPPLPMQPRSGIRSGSVRPSDNSRVHQMQNPFPPGFTPSNPLPQFPSNSPDGRMGSTNSIPNQIGRPGSNPSYTATHPQITSSLLGGTFNQRAGNQAPLDPANYDRPDTLKEAVYRIQIGAETLRNRLDPVTFTDDCESSCLADLGMFSDALDAFADAINRFHATALPPTANNGFNPHSSPEGPVPNNHMFSSQVAPANIPDVQQLTDKNPTLPVQGNWQMPNTFNQPSQTDALASFSPKNGNELNIATANDLPQAFSNQQTPTFYNPTLPENPRLSHTQPQPTPEATVPTTTPPTTTTTAAPTTTTPAPVTTTTTSAPKVNPGSNPSNYVRNALTAAKEFIQTRKGEWMSNDGKSFYLSAIYDVVPDCEDDGTPPAPDRPGSGFTNALWDKLFGTGAPSTGDDDFDVGDGQATTTSATTTTQPSAPTTTSADEQPLTPEEEEENRLVLEQVCVDTGICSIAPGGQVCLDTCSSYYLSYCRKNGIVCFTDLRHFSAQQVQDCVDYCSYTTNVDQVIDIIRDVYGPESDGTTTSGPIVPTTTLPGQTTTAITTQSNPGQPGEGSTTAPNQGETTYNQEETTTPNQELSK